MTDDWNHLAEVVSYEEAADDVRGWATDRSHFLVFMPPAIVADWPQLLDIPEFVILLDRGDDLIMKVTPAFWPYAQSLLPQRWPIKGVIAVPKTVPANLVRAEIGAVHLDEGKDLLICRGEEDADKKQVPIQRLLIEALHGWDPATARQVAAAAGL